MEFLVQATKGGYRILHRSQGFPSSFASDLRREDVINSRSTIGQSTYSIAFANNGIIYSKYSGVWDEGRNAIGNIVFSIFIPGNKRISGADVNALLDALSGRYR